MGIGLDDVLRKKRDYWSQLYNHISLINENPKQNEKMATGP